MKSSVLCLRERPTLLCPWTQYLTDTSSGVPSLYSHRTFWTPIGGSLSIIFRPWTVTLLVCLYLRKFLDLLGLTSPKKESIRKSTFVWDLPWKEHQSTLGLVSWTRIRYRPEDRVSLTLCYLFTTNFDVEGSRFFFFF